MARARFVFALSALAAAATALSACSPSVSSSAPQDPFAASKIFEFGWKAVTKRPVPAEDADDVTLASLVLFAASTAAVAAVAQRYAYKGSQKYLAPKLIARFGAPQIEA